LYAINLNAGVLEIAKKHHIATLLIEKEQFFKGNAYVDELKEAGVTVYRFGWFSLENSTCAYPGHSLMALLIYTLPCCPNMVARACMGILYMKLLFTNREKESGITIHYVDEVYDHGKIIFQATCPVLADDDASFIGQSYSFIGA
jgi:phosphoribosylglycinamide formyltransferase-1